MELLPRYIVEDDFIMLGEVAYQGHLATDKTKVKGGGNYLFDKTKNAFIFYGTSVEFGKASLEDVMNCVANGAVFSEKSKLLSVGNSFDYYYLTDNNKYVKLPNSNESMFNDGLKYANF